MRAANLIRVEEIAGDAAVCHKKIDGKYVPCRPLGWTEPWVRLKLAWGVFVGKYDALKWQGGQ